MIEQRHGAFDGAEQLRIAREHVADQKAAVAAADAGEPFGAGDAAGDEIFGDRREIVVRQFLALTHAGLVPIGPELAAAADVGDHVDAALLQPELAGCSRVVRKARNLKAAVAGQQHRIQAVASEFLARDLKVGNAHAVD